MSTPVAAGVRLEQLRGGTSGESLFLVPGLEGEPAELADLASAFTGGHAVYAVAPASAADVPDLTGLATRLVAAIRQIQPDGPYLLGGYSFGGLVAFEMAQQLRAAGETVDGLFLIDALFDERYWPRRTWMKALVRRTGWQLVRIVKLPPGQAIGELRHRATRLSQRLRRRDTEAPDVLRAEETETVGGAALAAIGGYRPAPYAGGLTLLASSVDHHFGTDTARLWDGYAERIDVQRIAGDHLTVMHHPASAAVIADVIDHRLGIRRPEWTGLRPEPGFARPMIVTTMRWFSAARLAHALAEAGFAVSACRPAGHPLEVVESLTGDYPLRRAGRLASLEQAINTARPDILLPDDERAWALLRKLHEQSTDPEIMALVRRSLGDPARWPLIGSRTEFAREAREAGARVPRTEAVTASPAGWDFPLVLKTDGSWGGRGVAIVRDGGRLDQAWGKTSKAPSMARATKRLLVNHDLDGLLAALSRRKPVVNVQQFVDGREAIVTVACEAGKVRDLVCMEVVGSAADRGPATMVRVIDHPAMAEAARRVVERFGLSGFCGMDFILTPTGEPWLLEMNPRVTPTAYLLVEGVRHAGRAMALFPPEETVEGIAEVVDTPVRSHALTRLGHEMAARRLRPLTRMGRRLSQRLTAPRY